MDDNANNGSPVLGILLSVLIVGATIATAIDAAQYSKQEYEAAFDGPTSNTGSSVHPFCCLLRCRDSCTIRVLPMGAPAADPCPARPCPEGTLLVRASDRMMVGNWDRGLRIVDAQMQQAAARGESQFTLRVREGEVGTGLLDGWPAFVNLALDPMPSG